jgi:hypothetical protein
VAHLIVAPLNIEIVNAVSAKNKTYRPCEHAAIWLSEQVAMNDVSNSVRPKEKPGILLFSQLKESSLFMQ